MELLYEGKAKKIYSTNNPDELVVEYKDDATAFNGVKRGTIVSKGIVNNKVSAHFFKLLEENGVATHFIKLFSDREMLVKRVEIVPAEVIVRNYSAGSIAKRLGLDEGIKFPFPVIEYSYKSDELGDPMINDDHIRALGLATDAEMARIREMALRVNEVLSGYLLCKDIILADFKLEFGRYHGQIILADEISPDTCRFWDKNTMEKLDKDRFRRDLGGVEEAYNEILKRLTGESVL
ncbi:MAG: phosphoribosylaminoimidazolesuccinocarboxamide synthase [Thermoanaerobacteraceae bacterium]|nr:phosphoribosylaminoimidazolesuccinocarboxamide synthase [Thermoanaerobacteraceae bacterium]